jgi:antitoxin component of MazEF toxin-antitoxin module
MSVFQALSLEHTSYPEWEQEALRVPRNLFQKLSLAKQTFLEVQLTKTLLTAQSKKVGKVTLVLQSSEQDKEPHVTHSVEKSATLP